METTDKKQMFEEMVQKRQKKHKRGRVFGGIFLIITGSLFVAREAGAQIPAWVFTWETLIIGIGIISGIKHGFRNSAWLILILIGSAFLISDHYPQLMISRFIWPSALILIGLFIVLKPRRKCNNHYYGRRWRNRADFKQDYFNYHDDSSSADALDVTCVMSHSKKNILTKNFKGGEITAVLGGSEIDFSQADFSGSVSLEVVAVLGGVKLIFPAHWEIESQLTTVMGGVDDKRPIQPSVSDVSKKIILRGTAIMGGIEISSY